MKGTIIGDVVGSRFEWANIKTKAFELFAEGISDFTDDSVLTMATAQALLQSFPGSEAEDYHEAFRREYIRFAGKYPGRGYGGRFSRWLHSGDHAPYNSCGNGSAMRVSPVAWIARTLEECEKLAKYSAEVTHDHPDGIAGAQATAGACWLGLHGAGKGEIRAYVEKYYKLDFTLDEIRADYHFGHFQALNAGTVPYAAEAFLESTDFEDCIRCAMSIGGDSDTLGAIAGAIAEAFYGVPDTIWAETEKRLDENARELVRSFYSKTFYVRQN